MEFRLQNVTIEDVKDEDSDTTTPTSLINGDEDNKLVRDFSFNSNKSSNKMSTKVKVYQRLKNYKVIIVLQNQSIRNSL